MKSLGLLALLVFYASLLVTSTASAGSTAIRGARRIRGASDQRKIIYISPLGSRSVLEDQHIPAPKTAPPSTLVRKSPVEPPAAKPPAKTTSSNEDDESIQSYSTQPSSGPSSEPSSEPSLEPDELIIAQIVSDVSIGEASPMDFGTGGIAAGAGAGLVLIFLIVHLVGKFVKEDKSVKSKEEDFSPKSICLDTALREAANAEQPFDLSGTFILVENHNFEAFLEAQGVPWALRSAANRTRPLHRITHKGNLLIIKFKGIPQTTHVINGPTVPSDIRGRLFEDAASYTAENDGVQILKQSVEENYTIRLYWRLSEDKSKITLTLTVEFHEEREPVESIQIFERVE